MAFFDQPLPLAQRAHDLDVLTAGGDSMAPHSREWAVKVRDACEGARTRRWAQTPDRIFGFTGPRPNRHAARDLARQLGVTPRTVQRWRKKRGEKRSIGERDQGRITGLAMQIYLSAPPGPSTSRRLREMRQEGCAFSWSGDYSAEIYIKGARVRQLRYDKTVTGTIAPGEDTWGDHGAAGTAFVTAALAGRWREAAEKLESAIWWAYFGEAEQELDGAGPEVVHTTSLSLGTP